MTNAPKSLDTFEEALLDELRGVVVRRRSAASIRRLRISAAATASLMAAAAAAISLHSSPAFAVQTQADGNVVVTIDRLDDSPALEHTLAAHGVTAHVSFHANLTDPVFDPGMMPAGATGAPADTACSDANVPTVEMGDSVRITIPAATVAAHAPLSIFTAGPSPASARLLVALGDRDSGCGAFDASQGWFTWGPPRDGRH